MSLVQFLSILRARFAWVCLIVLATAAAALAWSLLRPSQYSARAPVLVDVKSADIGSGYAPGMLASYIATQVDIARSDRVMERAIDLMRPGLDAAQRGEQVRAMQKRLEVKPARESNIIHIVWTGRSPEQAAQVANAVAEAFVDISLEIKTAPAKQDSGWFDRQVSASRQNLEQAQLRLSDFQQRAGIVGGELVDHELARLRELSTQLAQVQAQTTDSQSKRGAARDTVAEVMQSPLINTLKTDLARMDSRIEEVAASQGPRHPQMVQMRAERNALQSRLAAETRNIVGGIETSFRAGRERERELSAALDTQRVRVLALSKDRGRLAVLQQDLDSAQRAFESISTSAAKSRLESLTTQTNLLRLAPAAEPLEPKGPSPSQALLVGLLAGTLLGIGAALVLELADRRVRSVDDLTLGAELPVLAAVPCARRAVAALGAPSPRLGFSARGVG